VALCGLCEEDRRAVESAGAGVVVWLQKPPEFVLINVRAVDEFSDIPCLVVGQKRCIPMKIQDDEEIVSNRKVRFQWHNVTLRFSATINKVQGETLDKAIFVYDGKTTFEKFLVACTRVREADHLRIMPSLNLADASFDSLLSLKPDKWVKQWFDGVFDPQSGLRVYEVAPKCQPKKTQREDATTEGGQPKKKPRKEPVQVGKNPPEPAKAHSKAPAKTPAKAQAGEVPQKFQLSKKPSKEQTTKKTQRSIFGKRAGLRNPQNYCYFNATIQMIRAATARGLDLTHRSGLSAELLELFSNLLTSVAALDASNIKAAISHRVPEFADGGQKDAHEFLLALLDVIFKENDQQKLSEKFSWVEKQEAFCSSCTNRYEQDVINDGCLSLAMPQKPSSVQQLVDDYEAVEGAVADAKCDFCNKSGCTTYKKTFKTTPEILFLHLVRFAPDSDYIDGGPEPVVRKNSTGLKISETIRVGSGGELTQGDAYELFAIVHHRGETIGLGHYVADVFEDCGGEWLEYDDESVTPITREISEPSSTAYVLAYRRVPPVDPPAADATTPQPEIVNPFAAQNYAPQVSNDLGHIGELVRQRTAEEGAALRKRHRTSEEDDEG